jgi:hypothetical protein
MPKTVEKFINERKEIVNKMLNILEISETKKVISSKELENDKNKQNKIIELETEIQKYFICSTWTCVAKNDVKRFYLSLIKYLMKDMNYNMISSRVSLKDNNTGKFLNATLYHVIKK